jgi:hypothetical protein
LDHRDGTQLGLLTPSPVAQRREWKQRVPAMHTEQPFTHRRGSNLQRAQWRTYCGYVRRHQASRGLPAAVTRRTTTCPHIYALVVGPRTHAHAATDVLRRLVWSHAVIHIRGNRFFPRELGALRFRLENSLPPRRMRPAGPQEQARFRDPTSWSVRTSYRPQ